MEEPKVAVIIAAFNAGDTIANAIGSALSEPEVAEVVMVDDCSSDETAARARTAAKGDRRFTLIEQPFNQGPSIARNRAIEVTSAPFLAVLDADDAFLPGRFARIFAQRDWDLCADNIQFFRDPANLRRFQPDSSASGRACFLDFGTFVGGNISDRRVRRGEMGFLKPVISRAFLEHNGLVFNERCRLGEDFLLYAEALGLGARFKLLEQCGYAALEREDSLSASHSVAHLRALRRASRLLEERLSLSPPDRKLLRRQRRAVHEKVMHRELLEIKRYDGIFCALRTMLRHPTVMRDILRDLLLSSRQARPRQRILVAPEKFDRLCA